ncbi:MAG TPA: hypothetical protein VHB01_13510 [Nitrosospira sp.]|nr:hypothetical protein [Nitrosospira sp.]
MNSPVIEACVFQTAEKFYGEYGEPISNIHQAATHATGFALAIYGLGAPIESMRIHPKKKGYAGGIHYGKLKSPVTPALSVFFDVIANCSGFHAEEFMGLGHPSAVIDKKILAAISGNYLDKTFRKERGYFFRKALAYNRSLLIANRHVFNLLVFKLSKQMGVSPDEAKEAFKSAKRIPIDLERNYGEKP